MRKLAIYLLSFSSCLCLTPIMANEGADGSMKDVIVSFVMLDEQGRQNNIFSHDETIVFRIELTNPTALAIHDSYTAPGYVIAVYESATDNLLWQTHADMAFIQMLQSYVLKAGESKRIEHAWDLRDLEGNPLPPGEYTVKASLNIGLIGELEALSLTIK